MILFFKNLFSEIGDSGESTFAFILLFIIISVSFQYGSLVLDLVDARYMILMPPWIFDLLYDLLDCLFFCFNALTAKSSCTSKFCAGFPILMLYN